MSEQFDSYRIYYYSAPQYNWKVTLDLYNGNGFVGRVLFMKSGLPIPANVVMQNGKPLLHHSIDDFHNILLVLALEKPLYINLVAANGIGTISTSSESVGDLDKP
jgi:hypothetical protein